MATATATATATVVSLADLAGQKVQFQFEHPSFFALAINCMVEQSAMDTITLWVYDMDGTQGSAMMILPGDTQAKEAQYDGKVFYRVKLMPVGWIA